MLGRHHISITLTIAVLLVIPLVFLDNQNFVGYGVAFIIAVMIGSLTPDADCGGTSKLHYDFYIVDRIMKVTVLPAVLLIFNVVSKKRNLEYEVKEEHRGIMHSPIGVLISSILLTILLTIFVIFLGIFNIFFIAFIFIGLLFGQLLHLTEDTCTISGIKWKFPFKSGGELKGNVYTWDKYKNDEKTDIRPSFFAVFFGAIALSLFLIYVFNLMNINPFLVYLLIIFLISIEIFIMLLVSDVFFKREKPSGIWIRDRQGVKALKKGFNRFLKNASKVGS